MKKLLISLASGLVLDVLIAHATKERDLGGMSDIHKDRWRTILGFLIEMRSKGLPL